MVGLGLESNKRKRDDELVGPDATKARAMPDEVELGAGAASEPDPAVDAAADDAADDAVDGEDEDDPPGPPPTLKLVDDAGRGDGDEHDDEHDDDDDYDDNVDDDDDDGDDGDDSEGQGAAGRAAASRSAGHDVLTEIPTLIALPSSIPGAAEYNGLLRDWIAGNAAVEEWATAGYSTIPDGPIPDGWAPELDTRTDPGMGGVFYYHTDRNTGAQWELPEEPWSGDQPQEAEPEEEPEEELPPEPVPNPPTGLAVDDKVMCPQGAVLYMAYIIEVAPDSVYKIHYHGWSKKHDEYVHIDNMVAHDEQGLALQAWKVEALKRAKKQKLKPKPKPKPKPTDLKPPKPPFRRNKPKKRGKPRRPGISKRRSGGSRAAPRRPIDSRAAPPGPGSVTEAKLEPPPKPEPPALVQTESDFYSGRAEVRIPSMQDELKIKMVADWGNIANRKMLLKLPRETTVSLVLAGFCKHAAAKGLSSATVAAGFTEKLKEHFRLSLEAALLYPQEKAQFLGLGGSADLCSVYGPEHLLRLFTKLPAAMAQTGLGQPQTEAQVKCLVEIMRYMSSNSDKLFPADAYVKKDPLEI